MSLSRQQQKARLAQLAVRQATDAIVRLDQDPRHRELLDSESLRAVGALAELQHESSTDQEFRQALQEGVGFDAAGADLVIVGLGEKAGFQVQALGPAARVPLEEATTDRLSAEHSAWIQTASCREELTRRAMPPSRSFDPHHEFAPFLDWLTRSDIFPKVKAEALARIDLYIRSGHAAADLSPDISPDPRHAKTVLKMRHVAQRLRSGARVPEREVAAVLEQRFAQIFQPVRVQKRDHPTQGTLPLAHAGKGMGFSLFSGDHGATEGSGIVDAVIADRLDPTRWHVACTTSNDDPESQADQLPRHTAALLNSMAVGLPPFSAGDGLAELTFYAPAYLTAARQQWLGRSAPLTEPESAALNAVQLYAQMGHPSVNRHQVEVAAVLWARHQVAGGRSLATGGSAGETAALALQAAQNLTVAAQALAHPERAFDQERHGSGFVGPLIDLLVRSTQALATHFPDTRPHLSVLSGPLATLADRTEEAGFLDRADGLRTLARRLTQPSTRSKPLPVRRTLGEADLPPVLQEALRTGRREASVQAFSAQAPAGLTRGQHQRLHAAAQKASDPLWAALMAQGPRLLAALTPAQRRQPGTLDLDEAGQTAWLTQQAVQATQVERMQQWLVQQRAQHTAPSDRVCARLPGLARRAAPAVLGAVLSGEICPGMLLRIRVDGVLLTSLDEDQQDAWLAEHRNAHPSEATPTRPVSRRSR